MTSIPAGLLSPSEAVFPKGRKGYSIWQSGTWYQGEVLERDNYGERQTSHFVVCLPTLTVISSVT